MTYHNIKHFVSTLIYGRVIFGYGKMLNVKVGNQNCTAELAAVTYT